MASKRSTYGVFIGNLPEHSNEVTVGQIFRSFGEIDSIRVMETKKEGVKIAFVNFACLSDAEQAIRERNGYVYCGRNLNVSLASNSKNRESSSRVPEYRPQFQAGPNLGRKGAVGLGGCDREEEIILTHVESSVAFFAHLLRDRLEHQKLSRSLAEVCPRQAHITSKPLSNKIYGARFSEDGQWYRCRVLSTDFYDKSYVHYIDYGNRELVPHSWMVNLPHNLSTPPALALRCCLQDLVPVDPSENPAAHREGMAFLQTQLQERIVVAKLHWRPDGTYDIARLVLGDLDLHQQLLRSGFASRPFVHRPGLLPVQTTKPALERVNGACVDGRDSSLRSRVEQLELQLSQERGKVKAVTAEVQRLSKEKRTFSVSVPLDASENLFPLESLLQDLERVLLLRQQVPIDPHLPDYLEEAVCHYHDEALPDSSRKDDIKRVVEGLRLVYGNLLRTKSLNGDTFPIGELSAYYRRMKDERRTKCPSLAAETDAARRLLSKAAGTLAEALTTGKSFACPFASLCEKLQKCVAQELTAHSLESSDVTVLSVMAAILESALSCKLLQEAPLPCTSVLAQHQDLLQDAEEPKVESRAAEDDRETEETDDEADDLSSLRQKICPLPIAAT